MGGIGVGIGIGVGAGAGVSGSDANKAEASPFVESKIISEDRSACFTFIKVDFFALFLTGFFFFAIYSIKLIYFNIKNSGQPCE